MSKTLNFLRGSAVALLLATPGMADDSAKADTVVATVNGLDITLGHMIALRGGLDPQFQSLPDDVLFNGILDQLIQQTLLSETIAGAVPKRLELELMNQRVSLIATAVASQLIEDQLTEDAVQAAYDAQYKDFVGAPEFNASHILVPTEEEAIAIAEEVRSGADFATTAQEKSTGPSGPNGGSLGWFGPGQMVAPFEAAVETLEVGQVSDPVQTQFGWHVIILNDKRTQAAPALQTVRAQIEGQLQREIIDNEIARLEAEATIDRSGAADIDPTLLKQDDLLEN